MAPPRFKASMKATIKLVDEDDYLTQGDSHEEAMRKHRVGDPAKALRFADRALDVYAQGLAKFPRSFDLAYNKARLELEKATDSELSEVPQGPLIKVLQQALESHQIARDIDPQHADTLFNMAQVLTAMAEIHAEDDDTDDTEALQNIQQALECHSECFNLQLKNYIQHRQELEQAMRETAENQSHVNTPHEAPSSAMETQTQTSDQEGQWVSIEEPVTASTLLDTIIAQIEALIFLCSLLNNSIPTGPDPSRGLATPESMAWIQSYSAKLLTQTLPTLLNENRDTLESRLPEVALPRAMFTSSYLQLSLRMSMVTVEAYKQELDSAFAQPGLDATSPGTILESAQALLSFNNALADRAMTLADGNTEEAHAALRWKILLEAQSRIASVASRKGMTTEPLAKSHLLRGDISLLLQMLAYPPAAHTQARTTTPQLLSHAEVYYRNASKLYGSLGSPGKMDKLISELRGGIVTVLQELTAAQSAAGSSIGQDNSGTMVGLQAPREQIGEALQSVLKVKSESWARDQIEDMVTMGLIREEIFSNVL
ncbi:hypothetical protein GGR57DRAFT_505947 [Xylariaceae sp. FL1272]|nr:hypothetical protein GGR57DRAFT_505947 [Xylariaceae sp. FL1272]